MGDWGVDNLQVVVVLNLYVCVCVWGGGGGGGGGIQVDLKKIPPVSEKIIILVSNFNQLFSLSQYKWHNFDQINIVV